MIESGSVAVVYLAAASALALGLAWFSTRVAALPQDAPDRLVGMLRLSQAAAIILAVTGAVYAGLAVAKEAVPGAAADVGIAGAFAAVAMLALLNEPRSALMLLAAAFASHALVDIAHRPGMLPATAPRWLAVGGAVFDLMMAAICFLPVLRR